MIWKLFARRQASPKSAISRKTRTWKPTFESLEDRRLLSASWSEFALNGQHTAESPVASQDLQAIRWQTPVDLNPQYSGNDLLIHYGSPVITPSNTVIVPVKTGASGGFEVEALNGATGSVLWTQTTDYTLPPHNWTPSYSPVLTPQNRLYFAGIGGTIFYLDNPDSPGPHTATRLAFYGLSNIGPAYVNSVYIDTPLTADSQGNIFFGFRVTGANPPPNLTSGIARIAANGSGTWVSATSAVGDPVNFPSGEVPHNMAPALSNDQSTLYVGIRSTSTSYDGYLLGLDSTTLATKYSSGILKDPRNTNNAGLLDDSTASPMVGPDGDVYYGVFGNPYNGSRGWMLHFSSNLATEKIPGAFGWDDTASVVPAAMVPSYTGTSSYLIFTKYNNYAGITDGGDGVNKIAVLDPNATEVEPHASSNGLLVMKEILTIAGPTPDPQFINSGFPNAVREWCINSAAFDPFTCSVFANSEDGKLYRWDLDTNTLSQVMTLTPGIGEAYTTTLIGPDGTVYATNNATLFAVDAANHFSISAPAMVTAGSAFSVTMTALDVNNQTAVGYTGTIHFTSSDMGLGVSLPADYTFVAADAGVHTFSGVTLVTAGNQTVTATDTANASITGTSNTILVFAAAATHFAVSAPTSATAGSAFSFTVTAQDQFNNTATGYTGTVHFTSSDGQATLPADNTLSNGTGSFNATLKTTGSQTLTATDTADASITGTSNSILVSAAPATHFAVNAPGGTTAGAAFSFTVTAQDPFNNTATGYTGTVHFTSSDGQAVLPANSTLYNGTGSFSAALRTAGSQTITATDTADASITGTSNIVTVVVSATHFAVSAPASSTAGSAFSITVTALNDNNQTAVDYTGTVHFTGSDSGSGVSLPPDYTFMSSDAGVHTFTNGVTLVSAGRQTITATDMAVSTLNGSASVLVNPAAATSFLVAGYPSPVTAGTANSFSVTAKDPFGNTATGYTRSAHFTSSDPKAALPANYTFTSADAGVHVFSATLRTAGSQSITATDTGTASISGAQSGITVNAAATNHLVVSRFPSKTTAGVSQSFRVTAQDMFGNTTPGFADTVSFSSSDSKSVLPASYTFTSGDGGVHTFSAALVTVGSQSITVQDLTNANVASGTQAGISVNPAAASSLQVSGFPSSVIAGTAHSFTVTAFDPYGNVATGYRGTVMFSSSDNQAMLPANYPFTSGDAGVHTFSATLNTGGTQSITTTDTFNAGIKGAETGIAVVTVQPTASISGPSIGVPGQPLVFNLDASESGPSAGPPYTYSVHWGDGSPDSSFASSNSASAVMASHAFTVAGSFTVSVTATDPQGHTSVPASTSPVSITTLAMEADPYYPNQTALYLGGTTGNDNIAITPAVMTVNNSPVYGVKVGMNYVNYGSFFSISRVVVYSQGGTDIIKTAAQTINGTLTYVSVPVMFFSGGGNDILNLTGSGSNANTVSPNNVLVGGGGMDRLIGGQGKDILIGGAGQATLQAGSGGDILVGGTTAYDNNAAALAAILAEWTRTDIGYTTRMADLTNTTGGMNVINGMYFFLNNGMNGPRTVFGNGLADSLYGGAGLDWYFAGMMDVLFNKTNGEVVTPI